MRRPQPQLTGCIGRSASTRRRVADHRSGYSCRAIHAVEAAATPGAVVASRTGTTFVAATIQRTVAVKAVVGADRRSATLAAL